MREGADTIVPLIQRVNVSLPSRMTHHATRITSPLPLSRAYATLSKTSQPCALQAIGDALCCSNPLIKQKGYDSVSGVAALRRKSGESQGELAYTRPCFTGYRTQEHTAPRGKTEGGGMRDEG